MARTDYTVPEQLPFAHSAHARGTVIIHRKNSIGGVQEEPGWRTVF